MATIISIPEEFLTRNHTATILSSESESATETKEQNIHATKKGYTSASLITVFPNLDLSVRYNQLKDNMSPNRDNPTSCNEISQKLGQGSVRVFAGKQKIPIFK